MITREQIIGVSTLMVKVVKPARLVTSIDFFLSDASFHGVIAVFDSYYELEYHIYCMLIFSWNYVL